MNKLITPTLCIYHGNCADGFGAAFAVWLRYGSGVEYLPASYGETPPDCTGHDVLLVDFSYKLPGLEQVLKQAKSVTILDHHKTAEADIQPLLEAGRVHGEFDMNRSGAALAWDWCFPGKPRPRLIEHIQDRDLWHFHLEGTREISSVLFSHEQTFGLWQHLMRDLEDDKLRQQMIWQGEALQRKHMKDVQEAVRLTCRKMTIGGWSVPVANVPHLFASDAGNALAKGQPFAATYVDTESGRKFSLRSKKYGIDVSEIAKRFGGGGHARAAGFQVPIGWEGSDHVPDAGKMGQGEPLAEVRSGHALELANHRIHSQACIIADLRAELEEVGVSSEQEAEVSGHGDDSVSIGSYVAYLPETGVRNG